MSTAQQNAAKLIAGLMMAHYECGIENRDEFFPEDETIDGIKPKQVEQSLDWIGENMSELFDNSDPTNVAFRESVVAQLREMLQLPAA